MNFEAENEPPSSGETFNLDDRSYKQWFQKGKIDGKECVVAYIYLDEFEPVLKKENVIWIEITD